MGLLWFHFRRPEAPYFIQPESIFQMHLGRAGSVPEVSAALPTSSHPTPANRQAVVCESAFWTDLKRFLEVFLITVDLILARAPKRQSCKYLSHFLDEDGGKSPDCLKQGLCRRPRRHCLEQDPKPLSGGSATFPSSGDHGGSAVRRSEGPPVTLLTSAAPGRTGTAGT